MVSTLAYHKQELQSGDLKCNIKTRNTRKQDQVPEIEEVKYVFLVQCIKGEEMTIKTVMEGFVSDLLTLVGFHKTVDVAGSESGTSLLRSDTGVQWAIHEKRPMACIICFTKKQ